MAEQRRSGRGKRVPHHPLVEALASDPGKPPERATKLFGYPGPAADAKTTRLWLDLDLTSYVDVPDDAILHSQTLENDQGTFLWVDPAATLTYSSTQSHEVQADFLGGSIAERSLGAAAPAAGFGNVNTAATVCRSFGIACTVVDCMVSVVPHCPTVAPVCNQAVSVPPHCPTVPPMCGHVRSLATACPTVPPMCALPTIDCPSRLVQCESVLQCTSFLPCQQSAVRCLSFGRCPTIACGETIGCNDPVGPFRPAGG